MKHDTERSQTKQNNNKKNPHNAEKKRKMSNADATKYT